jgi:hypothetical protein
MSKLSSKLQNQEGRGRHVTHGTQVYKTRLHAHTSTYWVCWGDMQRLSSRKLDILDRCRPCRSHRGAPRPVYTTTCTAREANGSYGVYYLSTPCQAPNSTGIGNPPPPTRLRSHPQPPHAPPCRHPELPCAESTAPVAVLHDRRLVIARPRHSRPRMRSSLRQQVDQNSC